MSEQRFRYDPPHVTIERRLLVCASPEQYAAAVEAWSPSLGIPVIGSGPTPGFAAGLEVAGWAELPTSAHTTERVRDHADPRRVIAVFDEPMCLAGARLLGEATGRSVVALDHRRWREQLDELGASTTKLGSLSLVVPSWRARAQPDPALLRAVLTAMRDRHHWLRSCSWGLLSAADPPSFTRLIAKSLLADAIAAAYACEPSLVFTTGSASGNWISLPSFDPEHGRAAPLLVADDGHVVSKQALSVLERRWSLLFFKGHGRPYCACQGYLCGARSLDRSPTEATDCVLGMACASPRDGSYRPGFPAFPRVDPRRYDAPVMVMDCCGTGNLSAPVWAAGVPSVSFHAIAGAASAVITGDQVTMTRTGSYLDVLWALRSSANLGEAVARLNDARPEATARFPYFLLGDPELVAGRARWPDWVADAESDDRSDAGRVHARLSITAAPFSRVSLPSPGPADWTMFTSIERDAGVEVGRLRGFRWWAGAELWVELARKAGERDHVELQIEQRPSLTQDPGLVAAVLELETLRRAWTPTIQGLAEPLRKAGERVIRLATTLAELERRATLGAAADFEAAIALTRAGWTRAHAELLDRAVEALVAGGLWPFRLWSFGNFEGESDARACPHCGLSPTLLRRYRSWPAGVREQWECIDCALIRDRQPDRAPELSLQMSSRIELGQRMRASLVVLNPGEHRIHGAGMAVVDSVGHGVATTPARAQTFELEPGGRTQLDFELELREPAPIPHTYWARGLALIDGVWQLTSRPLLVSNEQA